MTQLRPAREVCSEIIATWRDVDRYERAVIADRRAVIDHLLAAGNKMTNAHGQTNYAIQGVKWDRAVAEILEMKDTTA